MEKMSETEMELMKVIWEINDPVQSNELLIIFKEKGKSWKGQTISTFLSRLVDKGLLLVNKQGRSNTYVPRFSPEEYNKYKAQSILNSMYQGSVKNFLSALYDGEEISEGELKELKQWFLEQ